MSLRNDESIIHLCPECGGKGRTVSTFTYLTPEQEESKRKQNEMIDKIVQLIEDIEKGTISEDRGKKMYNAYSVEFFKEAMRLPPQPQARSVAEICKYCHGHRFVVVCRYGLQEV